MEDLCILRAIKQSLIGRETKIFVMQSGRSYRMMILLTWRKIGDIRREFLKINNEIIFEQSVSSSERQWKGSYYEWNLLWKFLPVKGHRGRRSLYASCKRYELYKVRLATKLQNNHVALLVRQTRDGIGSNYPITQPSLHDVSYNESFDIFFVNAWSIRKQEAELFVRIESSKAVIVCVCETWLDKGVKDFLMPGYTMVSRRDRSDYSNRGGIIVFVKNNMCCITHEERSSCAERSWHTLRTCIGPILFAFWYRQKDDILVIDSFQQEYDKLSKGCIGTIFCGDLNAHNTSWLKHSSHT